MRKRYIVCERDRWVSVILVIVDGEVICVCVDRLCVWFGRMKRGRVIGVRGGTLERNVPVLTVSHSG